MSARKWPIFEMQIGEQEQVPAATWLLKRIHRYAALSGKVFVTRKRGEVRVVTRVA